MGLQAFGPKGLLGEGLWRMRGLGIGLQWLAGYLGLALVFV